MAKKKPGDWKTPPPCDIHKTGKAITSGRSKALKGTPVKVHLNLHNGCLVITKKGGGGGVAGYSQSIKLRNAKPRIQMAGYRRCHSSKVRNVHAWIEGEYAGRTSRPSGPGWRKITYRCKTHGPTFYYKKGGKTFEGAQEVRFIRTKTKAEVWVKGKPPARDNPGCGCQFPGGACDCGSLVNPEEGLRPCGSLPPEVGVHVAETDRGAYLLLLDLHNVRRYGPQDWIEGRCPLLAGWVALNGPDAGLQIIRDGVERDLAQALVNVPHDPHPDLLDLARRVGVTPRLADELLAWEGYQWHAAKGQRSNPMTPRPPFMPRRPFRAECLDAWGEVDPSTLVHEATASLHKSVVGIAQQAGIPVTPLHDGSGYILVLESEAQGVADLLRSVADSAGRPEAASGASVYESELATVKASIASSTEKKKDIQAKIAALKGRKGTAATDERKYLSGEKKNLTEYIKGLRESAKELREDVKRAKREHREAAKDARAGAAQAEYLHKAADELLGVGKEAAVAANPPEPPVYTTADGYTFYRQPDGSYTDAPDPRAADMTFRSFQELAAQDNPPAWGLSLEPVVGPLLISNPPPWYLPH